MVIEIFHILQLVFDTGQEVETEVRMKLSISVVLMVSGSALADSRCDIQTVESARDGGYIVCTDSDTALGPAPNNFGLMKIAPDK